ncbi:hypothetical protein 5 [Wuhan heteroptera virus 3]|uniref:hypothetical protein 5 n=1 Tax=Wuhan heteroptera virus 3 TaxID=1923703 RepID=UPI00090A2578|nr:hypothetical protein 5 [Wuhan heteroptera virus 3]APG79073.1 hypothetical protein 6 [Wuhan heteroptera virus 3]APG79209.1 hypothetical protein 5 [Wuhan heteroptera virus 3]
MANRGLLLDDYILISINLELSALNNNKKELIKRIQSSSNIKNKTLKQSLLPNLNTQLTQRAILTSETVNNYLDEKDRTALRLDTVLQTANSNKEPFLSQSFNNLNTGIISHQLLTLIQHFDKMLTLQTSMCVTSTFNEKIVNYYLSDYLTYVTNYITLFPTATLQLDCLILQACTYLVYLQTGTLPKAYFETLKSINAIPIILCTPKRFRGHSYRTKLKLLNVADASLDTLVAEAHDVLKLPGGVIPRIYETIPQFPLPIIICTESNLIGALINLDLKFKYMLFNNITSTPSYNKEIAVTLFNSYIGIKDVNIGVSSNLWNIRFETFKKLSITFTQENSFSITLNGIGSDQTLLTYHQWGSSSHKSRNAWVLGLLRRIYAPSSSIHFNLSKDVVRLHIRESNNEPDIISSGFCIQNSQMLDIFSGKLKRAITFISKKNQAKSLFRYNFSRLYKNKLVDESDDYYRFVDIVSNGLKPTVFNEYNIFALAIPNGNGKTTLCQTYPDRFYDFDEYIFGEEDLSDSDISGTYIKIGNSLSPSNRKHLYETVRNRILLVHSVHIIFDCNLCFVGAIRLESEDNISLTVDDVRKTSYKIIVNSHINDLYYDRVSDYAGITETALEISYNLQHVLRALEHGFTSEQDVFNTIANAPGLSRNIISRSIDRYLMNEINAHNFHLTGPLAADQISQYAYLLNKQRIEWLTDSDVGMKTYVLLRDRYMLDNNIDPNDYITFGNNYDDYANQDRNHLIISITSQILLFKEYQNNIDRMRALVDQSAVRQLAVSSTSIHESQLFCVMDRLWALKCSSS